MNSLTHLVHGYIARGCISDAIESAAEGIHEARSSGSQTYEGTFIRDLGTIAPGLAEADASARIPGASSRLVGSQS